MDEITARKWYIAGILAGGVAVAAVSIALAANNFPNSSAGGKAFIRVFIALVLLGLISWGARALVKAPRRLRLTAPMMFLEGSRLSFFLGTICLLVLALGSLVVDREAGPLLLRALVESVLIGAFWTVLTRTIINFALLSKRFRESVTQVK